MRLSELQIKLLLAVAIVLVLIMIDNKSHAAEINCYSGKTRIYHGYGNFVVFSDSVMSFVETKTQHTILVTGECLIMTRIKQGEAFYAADLRDGD